MLLAKGKVAKIAVIRPGALGDVLGVRSVIRFFKEAFPGGETSLVAPGERGTFFRRPGWADHVFDWERAAFSWLFGEGGGEPPPALQAVFAGADVVLSYLDFPGPAESGRFEERLERLAPAAGKVYCPSRPPAGHAMPIDRWLLHAAVGFCRRFSLIEDTARWWGEAAPRIAAPRPPVLAEMPDRYFVIHSGSGDSRKNWPVEKFGALGRLLAGCGEFGSLVATAGEADGDLGRRLASLVPGSTLVEMPSLGELAGVLAHAGLYVGNDSGVSHLAAAVESEECRYPAMATVFGPSDPLVWAPPGALVLSVGEDMAGLTPEEAYYAIVDACRRQGMTGL